MDIPQRQIDMTDTNIGKESTDSGFRGEYKRSPSKSARGNTFDSHSQMKRRIRRFMQMYKIESYMQLSRLLGVRGGATVWRWMHTSQRPNARYTSRLLELAMWAQEGIPISQIDYVDWDLKRWVWKEGYRGESRRYLSPRDWSNISHSEKPARHRLT